ncbi:hypothetical protein [Streptomyces cavernicola]|uniref:DUF1963 domain-containing protein n=1 Tax=Streptomyces cavernicola TaxID=3043613 RepID=A0ABT6S5C0_9ACTN|nr:hypothetical protein [Streptomyces sp. B-S-A6]MDI3403273.1 hypothetical protein [Streptomyces sp. B-S-A6]
MKTPRTTPPRPLDVTALFPQLAPLARTVTRLHPRPASPTPTPRDSSVGGPLLWPADEPWPYCDRLHTWDGMNPILSPDDVRSQRRIRAAVDSRLRVDPNLPPSAYCTPEERAELDRIKAGRPWPEGPVPLLPVAQLYVRDVPGLPAPAGADLLQVLWCPFDHPPENFMPRTVLFWRSEATITDVLAAPPEPPAVQFDDYVPEPCLLAPEQVTEYPHSLELSMELRGQIEDWSSWQAAEPAVDDAYASYPQEFYDTALSVAPGWKVGGWAPWGLTDPVPRSCPACATEMVPLLTIATFEWDDSTRSWIPDEAAPAPTRPTAVQIGRGYKQQLYVCPAAPEHPHTELMQ